MRALLILALLLLAAPAEAVQITDLRLNCAGLDIFGGIVHNVSCEGQGLFLDAVVTGFPVSSSPVVRFALALDGAEIASETRTLPADLGPIPGFPGEHYTGLGMGWRLPLDTICNLGCTGDGLASLNLIGGSDPSIAFTLDVPTPEPTTLLFFATMAPGLLIAAWRRRRG